MTITATTALAGPYAGNEAVTDFVFNFKCFDETHLGVYIEASTGLQTKQTITTHYTVSLNADQEATPGGTVTMLTAPAASETVFVVSEVPYNRPDSFSNAGGFYPNVLNDGRDRTTLQIQQLNDKLDRAILAPIGDTVAGSIDTDDLSTVAARIADVAVVAARDTDIGTVADRDSDIGVVADALLDGTITSVTVEEASSYDTRAALTAATDSIGNIVRVLGYTTAGDGGGAYFVPVVSEPSHEGKIQDGNSNWYEYYADDQGIKRCNVRAFGAVGDGVNSSDDTDGTWTGTDDTTAFANCEDAADNLGYPRYIPNGNYIITDSITREDSLGLQTSGDVHWYGESRDKAVVVAKYVMGPNNNLWGYIGTADSETATTVQVDTAVTAGDDTLSVNDASLLTPGQWVWVMDHSQAVWDPLTGGVTYDAGDIAAVADGITSSTIDFTADARYAVNEWIYVGGAESGKWRFATAGSTWAKIQSVTSGKVTFAAGTYDGGWTTDAGSGKNIRVRFYDDRACVLGYPAQVLTIDEGTDEVRLKQSAPFDMTAYTGTDAHSGLPRGTTIRRFTSPQENFKFENFTVAQHQFPFADNAGSPSTDIALTSAILQFVRCLNVDVDNVKFLYPQSYEIELDDVINFRIRNTEHYNLDLDNEARYTIAARAACFGLIDNCKMYGGRHFTDGDTSGTSSIESANVVVSNCLASGTYGAPFGTHFGARNWWYNQCHAVGNHLSAGGSTNAGQAGFQPRGRFHRITNCSADGFQRGAYVVYVDDITVQNNDFRNNVIGLEINSAHKPSIVGNEFSGNTTNDIWINDDFRYNAMGGVYVVGNNSRSDPTAAFKFGQSGKSIVTTYGGIWIFHDNYAQFATTKHSGFAEGDITGRDRAGEEFQLYNDETDMGMTLDAGNSSFQRARILTGYDDLSIMVDSKAVEAFRFGNGVNISYKALQLREDNTATLLSEAQDDGTILYCNDGNTGNPCLAVRSGGNWLRVALGATIAAS